MKKLLFILSIVLFVACSSDDDNGKKQADKDIVGYWKFDYAKPIEVETNSASATEAIKSAIRKDKAYTDWEFKADGTYKEYDKYVLKGTYYVNGAKLFITPINGSGTYSLDFEIKDGVLIEYIDATEGFQEDFSYAAVRKVLLSLHYVSR